MSRELPKLTKRQDEVLSWLRQGFTNKQVARQLKISESTVKLHLTDILRKYGCQNSKQLIVSNLSGQAFDLPDLLPRDVEPKPVGWILRKENGLVLAVSFETDQPSPAWEAMYTRRGK